MNFQSTLEIESERAMFSNLGPLFKTVFRQAEETDTRQAIKREEKKQNRKRKEDEEDHRISVDLWEDKSSVSVEALQSFLITFIKGETFQEDLKKSQDKTPRNEKPPKENASTFSEKQRATTTAQQRAVSAYQSMSDKITPQEGLNESPSLPTADADLIESKEARDIYTLIKDLDYLKEQGVTEIFIEPAESFVESLRYAVYLQKLRLKR